MTTRGPNSIFSGEIMPLAPELKDPELNAFHRNLLDYLRRLTGKLSRHVGGGGGTVETFSAYANEQSLGTGAVVALIPWNNELLKDSTYTHDVDSGVITVSQSGLYIVHCDVQIFKNFAAVFRVAKVDSGGTDISLETYIESTYPSPGVAESVSFMVPLLLDAGESLGVFMAQTDAYVSPGTRIAVNRIAI